MVCIPEVGDILAAVISLACQGGEQLSVPGTYSAICELKGRNALLSVLYFSITGAVCYSRQIEAMFKRCRWRRDSRNISPIF